MCGVGTGLRLSDKGSLRDGAEARIEFDIKCGQGTFSLPCKGRWVAVGNSEGL